MAVVRIPAAKRAFHQELVDRYIREERCPEGFGPCTPWAEGQALTVEGFS